MSAADTPAEYLSALADDRREPISAVRDEVTVEDHIAAYERSRS